VCGCTGRRGDGARARRNRAGRQSTRALQAAPLSLRVAPAAAGARLNDSARRRRACRLPSSVPRAVNVTVPDSTHLQWRDSSDVWQAALHVGSRHDDTAVRTTGPAARGAGVPRVGQHRGRRRCAAGSEGGHPKTAPSSPSARNVSWKHRDTFEGGFGRGGAGAGGGGRCLARARGPPAPTSRNLRGACGADGRLFFHQAASEAPLACTPFLMISCHDRTATSEGAGGPSFPAACKQPMWRGKSTVDGLRFKFQQLTCVPSDTGTKRL